MRVKIRSEIDLNSPVELSELKPIDRVITSLRYKYTQSKIYQNKIEKEMNKEYRARIDRMEGLKDIMLAYIVAELGQNRSMEPKGEVCTTLILSVERSYDDIIEDVLDSKDFLSFEVAIIEENSDMLLSFPNLPILVEIKKKVMGEGARY